MIHTWHVVANTVEIEWATTEQTPYLDVQTWTEVAGELTALVPEPERARLVIADNFARTVDAYARQAPYEYGGAGDAEPAYDPDKPDGARSGAKTIPLTDMTVIVVDAGAIALGALSVRRLLHHEAQHVRLRQHGDMAWALHRRGPFTRPPGAIFAFVYVAQSLLDEYRCETALEPAVAHASAAMTVAPADFADIAAMFEAITDQYRSDGDLEAAFTSTLAGLDRLASFAAYATATIVRGEQTRAEWAAVEPVMIALDELRAVPSAAATMPQEDLAETVQRLATKAGLMAVSVGFRIEVDEDADQTSFFLLNV